MLGISRELVCSCVSHAVAWKTGIRGDLDFEIPEPPMSSPESYRSQAIKIDPTTGPAPAVHCPNQVMKLIMKKGF